MFTATHHMRQIAVTQLGDSSFKSQSSESSMPTLGSAHQLQNKNFILPFTNRVGEFCVLVKKKKKKNLICQFLETKSFLPRKQIRGVETEPGFPVSHISWPDDSPVSLAYHLKCAECPN